MLLAEAETNSKPKTETETQEVEEVMREEREKERETVSNGNRAAVYQSTRLAVAQWNHHMMSGTWATTSPGSITN